MSVTENIDRIEQGKTSIIGSIKSKGVNVPNDVLINEIAPYINEIQSGGGGGDTPSQPDIPELVQKYEGATVIRVNIPTDNYEFAINLCNNTTKATYDVDWGDGSLESGLTTDEQHHTYAKAGIYDINIYNISNNITFGGDTLKEYGNGNSFYVSYLFNNTNNDYWAIGYKYIRDLIISNILIGDKITTIGKSAFRGCSSLQSVVITEGVGKISDYAFSSCSSLQSIVIPESVTSIGSSAFSGCSSLQSIVIPESVGKISDYAFNNCSSLQSVVIPESVTSIGSDAFQYCTSLQSVVIPESVGKISDYAFSNCSSLQSVVITEGVTSIGSFAFQYCTSLQSVVIPEGVTSIGSYAFQDCSSLQSIVIPEGGTAIGSGAFQYCTSLQSVTVNALTAPTIQSNSFITSGFKYTKRYLYVPKGATGYDEGYWKTYLIDKGWELRYIEEHIKTPTTLKLKTTNNFLHKLDYIGGAKLVDYELVDNEYIYHFDDKIEEIIQYTFYKEVLEEIELPESVTSIGSYAFQNCTSLQSITVNAMTAPTIKSDTFSKVGTSYGASKILRVPKGATGYDEGYWKTSLIDKGYTLEYIE